MAFLHTLLNEHDAAKSEVENTLRIDPEYNLKKAKNFYLSVNAERKRAFLDSLRNAGLPE